MDNVLYTDGHGIKVTTSNFSTGNSSYRIDGILNAYMKLIRAQYAPALFLILIGFAGIIAGALHLIPDRLLEPFLVSGITVTINLISIILGALMLITGVVMLAARHDKYSVHIVTAEGEKDPVVSVKKDYVNQIVSALEYALRLRPGYEYK